MPGVVLAAVNPDNTPHGYNWTFAFPMLLFIVIALILYGLYSRPHRRVPGRPIQLGSGSRAQSGGAARAAGERPAGTEAGGATLSGSVSPEDQEPDTGASE